MGKVDVAAGTAEHEGRASPGSRQGEAVKANGVSINDLDHGAIRTGRAQRRFLAKLTSSRSVTAPYDPVNPRSLLALAPPCESQPSTKNRVEGLAGRITLGKAANGFATKRFSEPHDRDSFTPSDFTSGSLRQREAVHSRDDVRRSLGGGRVIPVSVRPFDMIPAPRLLRFLARVTLVGFASAMAPGVGSVNAAPALGTSPDFQEHILPLLYNRCYSCHSEKQEKPKGKLRLDSAEGIRESGVIIPGRPDDSELLARISAPLTDDDHMPPLKGGGQPLNESEQALLRRWIADGANVGGWVKFAHRQPAVEVSGSDLSRADVPPLTQRVNQLVRDYHQAKGTALNPPIGDEEFLRRVYLDIAGRIPSLAEGRAFLHSQASDKRARLIDTLLASEAYVSHTFNWKADQLRLLSRGVQGQPGRLYDDWLKSVIRAGTTYDDIVRQLVTASGYLWENGAVGFYLRDMGMPLDHMSNMARVFLGTRLECAQCHDHPLEPITQKDFYQLTAYTYGVSNLRSSVGYSNDNVRHWGELQARLKAMNAGKALREGVSRTTSYLKRLTNDTEHLLTFPQDYADEAARGTAAEFRTLFGDEAPATAGNRREALADWLVSKRNPRFGLNLANRLWKRVMGVGLIEPVDSLSPVNRPEQPALLEFLSHTVARLGFDERTFLAVLLNSDLYQSGAHRDELEPGANFPLTGPMLRRLSAEQVWDSMLVFLIRDVDERKSLLRHDQTELSTERLVSLTRMTADEVMERAHVEMEHRERARAHRIELADEHSAIKAAKEAGDFKLARRLEKESSEKDRLFEDRRNAIQMGNSRMADEMDPRWIGLSPALVRASELTTPIELGHFLRQFGQSDRREIDAFNKDPNITHSLALMNGALTRSVLEEGSFLRASLRSIENSRARVRALFQAVLVRLPTAEEEEHCRAIFAASATPEQDIIWSLVNSPEFLFLQ